MGQETIEAVDDPDSGIVMAIGAQMPGMTLDFIRASPDCIKVIEADGTISYMSNNGLCAMEIPDHAMVKGKIWWSLWPAAARDAVEAAFRAALRGDSTGFVADCPTATGTPKRWSVALNPVLTGAGQVGRVLSTSRELAIDGTIAG